MLISTRERYALRVLIDMTEQQADGYLPLKEVAQRQEISEKYMKTIYYLQAVEAASQHCRSRRHD